MTGPKVQVTVEPFDFRMCPLRTDGIPSSQYWYVADALG
jgi:hypothetical protein